MAKKKNDKEEKSLNTWMPIGVMIESVVGMILSFKFDNFLYLGGCVVGGQLITTMIGSIFAEDNVIIEFKNKSRGTS